MELTDKGILDYKFIIIKQSVKSNIDNTNLAVVHRAEKTNPNSKIITFNIPVIEKDWLT